MNASVELTALSALDQIRAIFAGKTGYEGIVKTLDLHPVSAEKGFAVFTGSPTQAIYNPLGVVHGGYAATLLDTVMGCAVQTFFVGDEIFFGKDRLRDVEEMILANLCKGQSHSGPH